MRKYEYETGRFISIDPLWNKYYGWTPYQYSMNSPVGYSDGNGYVVIKKNFTADEDQGFENTITFLGSLESGVISSLIENAYGVDFDIYLNSLSKYRDEVNSSTPSNVGRSQTLEEEWKKSNEATGLTLKKKNTSPESDIILASELLEDASESGNYNIFNTVATTVIDELNHATQLDENTGQQDHFNLINHLKFEFYNYHYSEGSREKVFIRETIERLEAHYKSKQKR